MYYRYRLVYVVDLKGYILCEVSFLVARLFSYFTV